MLSRLDQTFSENSHALDVRVRRQQLLAGNIANADTPHYKARDLDFQAAMNRSAATLAMQVTDSRHLPLPADAAGAGDALFRQDTPVGLDGNNVSLDKEQAAFAENSLGYQAQLNFMGAKLRHLMTAIKGG